MYAQVGGFGFVNFDDPDYVAENPHVRGGITADGVRWAFTSGDAANWFPLTRLSHMLDVELFGLRAGWHHLVNVLIHALAALLLFGFLNRATQARWPSALAAFLFALHPLHVESVAWIAERKDVLSALFWFLALWAYVRGRKWLVLAAFCLGLMAKLMIVTLPFVLLLMDVWPLRRPRAASLIWGKLPLFALSAAAAVATYLVQRESGAVQALEQFPLGLRIENALVTYLVYLLRTIWPARLAAFYPYPAHIPLWQAALAAAPLAGITAAVLRLRRDRPYLAVGWLWFLGTLVPVIGLVQVGAQARADRYMYVPMAGLAIMLSWGIAELQWKWAPATAATFVAVCMALTAVQAGYWRSSETLFGHALDVTEGNYLAHHNLGVALAEDPSRTSEAIAQYQAALDIQRTTHAPAPTWQTRWRSPDASRKPRRSTAKRCNWSPGRPSPTTTWATRSPRFRGGCRKPSPNTRQHCGSSRITPKRTTTWEPRSPTPAVCRRPSANSRRPCASAPITSRRAITWLPRERDPRPRRRNTTRPWRY